MLTNVNGIIDTHVCNCGVSALFSRVHDNHSVFTLKYFMLLLLLWAYENYKFVNVIKRVIEIYRPFPILFGCEIQCLLVYNTWVDGLNPGAVTCV